MINETILQVRIDAELKEQVEALYRNMGTTFSEAVRVLAEQSVRQNEVPNMLIQTKRTARGILSHYANPELIGEEKNAFERAMVDKHAKTN